MTAEEWKNRIVAIGMAYLAGDHEPLEITCELIASMEAKLPPEPVVVPVVETPLFHEQDDETEDHQNSEV